MLKSTTNNPLDLMWDLGQYLEIKKIPRDHELLIIKSALKCRAKSWYFANPVKWDKFDDLKAEFLEDFF